MRQFRASPAGGRTRLGSWSGLATVLPLVLVLALAIAPAWAYDIVQPGEVDAGLPYDVRPVPVTDPGSLAGVRVALVAAHGFEEVEATYPLEFLTARGAVVDVITPDWIKDRVMAVRFLKPSVWIPVTKTISAADPADYDAVIIPGGAWNPIIMRTDGAILAFVQKAARRGTLIASICHGPQVLISAGLVAGREVTGVGDIRPDLRHAGATVHEDRAVVLDGNLLTSRDPNDLAEFAKAIEAFLTARARFDRLHAGPEATPALAADFQTDTASGLTAAPSRPAAPARSGGAICPVCEGNGRLHGGPGFYPYPCPTCGGTGHVQPPSHQPPVSTDH
ncbi:MAG: hypothetical protein GX442_13215 [Candidatus Riflebacteria bacterium]|nr:hypothetical protein [Candidatus Riflebacteria bacterium]